MSKGKDPSGSVKTARTKPSYTKGKRKHIIRPRNWSMTSSQSSHDRAMLANCDPRVEKSISQFLPLTPSNESRLKIWVKDRLAEAKFQDKPNADQIAAKIISLTWEGFSPE